MYVLTQARQVSVTLMYVRKVMFQESEVRKSKWSKKVQKCYSLSPAPQRSVEKKMIAKPMDDS